MIFIKVKPNIFRNNKKEYTVKQISHFIREGYEIQVLSDGIDETKEFLLRAAFDKDSPKGNLKDYLLTKIESDDLIEIIENGGIDNYLRRLK